MKKEEQATELAKVEAKGFSALRQGLGLAPGNYSLLTPCGEDIFGIKEVTSKDGKGYALTMVAGTVWGKDEDNKHVSQTFGLGNKDRNLVVPVDQWTSIDPNQVYDIVVSDKGRIHSLQLAAAVEEIVPDAEVIAGSTKTKNKVAA